MSAGRCFTYDCMSQPCYEINVRNGEQQESETTVSMSLMWPLSFHVKIYYAVIIALFFLMYQTTTTVHIC